MDEKANKNTQEDSEGSGRERGREFEPLAAIGVFLLMFGAIITWATTVPEEFWDRMINLAAGLTLLAIGLFCFLMGRSRAKKAARGSDKEPPG